MKKTIRITLYIVLAFIVIYAGSAIVATKQSKENLCIIGYHHIAADEEKETTFKNNMWVASLSSFEEQMKLLSDLGYHSATLDDVYAWRIGEKTLDDKTIVITFDDGFLSTKELAAPILEKYGFTASVFVIGSQIDNHHGAYDATKRQHTSLADMKDQRVLSYYSHTYDLHHKGEDGFKINTLSKTELEQDYEKQQNLVSNRFVAYPYGEGNETMYEVLKEKGTLLGFGFNENRKATLQDNPYLLPRFCINAYTHLDVFRTMLEN